MQKAVLSQQKQLMSQMNANSYQVVDQAFLSQLKSVNMTMGPASTKGASGALSKG